VLTALVEARGEGVAAVHGDEAYSHRWAAAHVVRRPDSVRRPTSAEGIECLAVRLRRARIVGLSARSRRSRALRSPRQKALKDRPTHSDLCRADQRSLVHARQVRQRVMSPLRIVCRCGWKHVLT
jgi:hypothetical protein